MAHPAQISKLILHDDNVQESPYSTPVSHHFNDTSGPTTMQNNNVITSDSQSFQYSGSNGNCSANIAYYPSNNKLGLCASIAELVSARCDNGQITDTSISGEVAFWYKPPLQLSSTEQETVRIEKFDILEKINPNPMVVEHLEGQPNRYKIKLRNIINPILAFRYQLKSEEYRSFSYAPLSITPVWKIEPSRVSVIVSCSLNDNFVMDTKTSLTLDNLVIIVHLEGCKAASCQSKPVGTFSRERSIIYWRLGMITLDKKQATKQLRARFLTESEGRSGQTEARWEVSGNAVEGFGSHLGISKYRGPLTNGLQNEMERDSSFGGKLSLKGDPEWEDITIGPKIISGTYIAT